MKVKCIENFGYGYIMSEDDFKPMGFVEEEKSTMKVKCVQPDVNKLHFEIVSSEEEFEPINAENIRQVLEYNGFQYPEYTDDKDTLVKNNLMFQMSDYHYYFRGDQNGYGEYINTKDFNKVLDFMKEFINLKPLPKKPEFDAKQFLIDNGFEISPINRRIIYNKLYLGHLEEDHKSFYLSDSTYETTKENLELIVQASKILEKLQ